jgi:transposase-like protein
MTRSIPPSEQIRQQLDHLLKEGVGSREDLLGELVQRGAQVVIQEALERETTERLGRAPYERRGPGETLRGYRNGYEPAHLRTAEGEVAIQMPQVQQWAGGGPYRSRLMAFLGRHSDVLERLAVEMYVRGLSVRGIETALQDATGEPLLSWT